MVSDKIPHGPARDGDDLQGNWACRGDTAGLHAYIGNYVSISDGNLPSWLQAFAAIVALGIAVWGTLRADRAVKRRERLQARCIATAILPDIVAIEVYLGRSRSLLKPLCQKQWTM
jgi:hypothetical protein